MRLIFLSILFFHFCSQAQVGIVYTVAGTGSPGIAGDGGLATAASIGANAFVVFDSLGDYYFSAYSAVRKVSPTGIISRVTGGLVSGFSGDGGPASSAIFHNTSHIAFDRRQNIYIGDLNNNRIRRINRITSVIETVVGTGTAGFGGDGGAATAAQIYAPYGIVFDSHNNMYFSDYGNNRIRKVDTNGIISTIAGTGSYTSFSGDGGPSTSACVIEPTGLGIDMHDNLFACISGRVRKVNLSTGIISAFAGDTIGGLRGDGGRADTAGLGTPVALAFDAIGNLYICDMQYNNVRMVDTFQIMHSIAGTGSLGFSGDGGRSDSATFSVPRGVAVDQCGNVFICDNSNYRIRKVTYPGTTNATISITASPSDTVCPGMPVLFDATIALGGATPGYRWYVNGIARDSGSSRFTYIPTAGDSVWCVLTSSSPCAVPPVVSSNVVHMVPRNLGITIAAPPWGIVGTNVTAIATITGSDTASCTYKWYNHSVYATTTAIPRYTYIKAAGIDTIAATLIYNHTDCTDSATSNRIVVRDSVLGIATVTMPDVEIYPNPAQSTLGVTSNYPIDQLEILNVVGQQLRNTTPQAKQTEITIGDLPKGMYLLRINGCIVRKWLKD